MYRYLIGIIATQLLLGCKSTPNEQYLGLAITEAELRSLKWQELERFPPLYPIEEAKAGNEGCASVEYVITPNYKIKGIKVAASTSKHFAKQAKINVKKWRWSKLSKGIIKAPIKTITQFQFCLETGDGHCAKESTYIDSKCSGEDAIYSTGYRITHGR